MLRSGITLSLVALLISAVSFVNQLVLASYFGASIQMSAYLVGYSVPAVFTGALGMLFSFSAVPVLVKQKQIGEGYPEVLGSFAVLVSGAGITVLVIGWVISGSLIRHIAPNLPTSIADDTLLMCRLFWANAGVSMLMALLVAAQNVERRFAMPLLCSGLPYVGMVVITVVLGHRWGTKAVAVGMLVGTLAGIATLFIPMRHSFGWRGITRRAAEAFGFLYKAPLVLLAMSCFCAGSATEAFWAMRLQPRELAYLGYSQRLVVVLGALVAFGPSAVLMTRLSELHARQEKQELRNVAAKALRMSLFVTTPIALLIGMFARPTIRLVFQRGAFDAASTAGVAAILPLVMVGSVGMCASVMMMKALCACSYLRQGAVVGVLQVITYFLFAGLLSSYWGLHGIVLAFAISWWAASFELLLVLWWKHHQEFWLSMRTFLPAFTAVLVIQAVATVAAKMLLFTSGTLYSAAGLALRLAVTCCISAVVFLITSACVFHLPEMHLLIDVVRTRLQLRPTSQAVENTHI